MINVVIERVCEIPNVMSVPMICSLQTGCNVAHLGVLAKCRRFNNGGVHLAPLSKEPALS